MKIAISTTGKTLDDNLDLRFGRAKGLIIYNISDDTYKYIDNEQNLNAQQGAGIQVAQTVVDEGVSAIITGYCGPKAYAVLFEDNIKVYTAEQMPIKNIIEKFKNNELKLQEE